MRRVAVVLPLLVLLAGCGGGGSDSTASTAGAGDTSADSGAKSALSGSGGDVQAVVDKAAVVAVPRSLIKTAHLQVRVREVKRATASAEQIVLSAGGEVSDERLDLHAQDPTATLRLRIPPARLTGTLTRLSELGDEQARTLGTEDVTDKVIDLESRLATQRTSVARVRALLDRAQSLADVVRIEAELSRREADLESLQARSRAVAGQVELSDVTLELSSRAEPAKAAGAPGFMDGLRGGWDAFLASARVVAATVGALLPFVPLLVGAVWAALWWRRRVSAA